MINSLYKIKCCSAILVFSFILLLANFLPAEEFRPNRVITYKKVGGGELKLHLFEPANHKNTDKRSAIIFFHGGGWTTGSSGQFYPQSKYLASNGMLAISAEYRTEKKYGTSPRESISDAKSAIRWVRQHAAELGINPNMLAAGGGSAGGHLALNTAMEIKWADKAEEEMRISSRPDALVLFNPIIDTSPKGYGYEKVKDYWQEISPIHNLNNNMPPVVMFLGKKDRFIPVSSAEKFKRIMNEFGIRCDLILYDEQDHGFFNFSPNNKFYYLTRIETEKFLKSLGYF